MIQPDANADSPNEVSAGKDARDEPLSLPPDEVGELIEVLRDHANELDVEDRHLVVTREFIEHIRQAASTLSRLRGERDFAQTTASIRNDAIQELLAVNRKLVEGLRPFAEAWTAAQGLRPWNGEPGRQAQYDAAMREDVSLDDFERANDLLSSISGGEAAGEDGP